MADTKCRKCLLREAFPEDYRKYVASQLILIPAGERSPRYEERLQACSSCDQLNGGTCMGCGCLVELRAAYARRHCPFRKW